MSELKTKCLAIGSLCVFFNDWVETETDLTLVMRGPKSGVFVCTAAIFKTLPGSKSKIAEVKKLLPKK